MKKGMKIKRDRELGEGRRERVNERIISGIGFGAKNMGKNLYIIKLSNYFVIIKLKLERT
jgi:hypothetical protein